MKTNILPTPNPQTALKFVKGKCSMVMALVFLSNIHVAVSADITSTPVPQRQQIPSGPSSFAIPTPPVIPSTETYQACLSKAMDIIDSGACNTTSNILNCIKAQFIVAGDNCAIYL